MKRARQFVEWRRTLNPPTFTEAARVLTDRRGAVVTAQQCIGWETCRYTPSRLMRHLLQQLTHGALKQDGWEDTFEDGLGRNTRIGKISTTTERRT